MNLVPLAASFIFIAIGIAASQIASRLDRIAEALERNANASTHTTETN